MKTLACISALATATLATHDANSYSGSSYNPSYASSYSSYNNSYNSYGTSYGGYYDYSYGSYYPSYNSYNSYDNNGYYNYSYGSYYPSYNSYGSYGSYDGGYYNYSYGSYYPAYNSYGSYGSYDGGYYNYSYGSYYPSSYYNYSYSSYGSYYDYGYYNYSYGSYSPGSYTYSYGDYGSYGSYDAYYYGGYYDYSYGNYYPDSTMVYNGGDSGSKNYTVSVGDDFNFQTSQSRDGKVKSMTLKFKDFFNYAIVQGENVNATKSDVTNSQCFTECGSGQWNNMCCASVAMYETGQQTVDYTRMCMDTIVADANIGMWIDDNYFTIECDKDNRWGSSKSGAAALAASATAVTAMVAATLF